MASQASLVSRLGLDHTPHLRRTLGIARLRQHGLELCGHPCCHVVLGEQRAGHPELYHPCKALSGWSKAWGTTSMGRPARSA